jgi:hypothetical protein
LSRIVAKPSPSAILVPTGFERLTVNVSVGPATVLSSVRTSTVFVVSPGAKVTVPVVWM